MDTQMDYVEPVEICNRCIVVRNAASYIRARQDGFIVEDYHDFSNMPGLIEWARRMVIRGADIEMNAFNHAFKAVTTWHGDPVCQVHIFALVDQEERTLWRR